MDIPVLIEVISHGRFQARSGEPVPLVADGQTREEALANLRGLLDNRLSHGTELVSMEIGKLPCARFAGWLKDDPLFDEWQQAIAENRRQEDEAEGIR